MKLQVTVNGSVYDVEVEVEEEPLPTLGAVLVGGMSAYSLTPTATKAPATSANALTSPVAGTVAHRGWRRGQGRRDLVCAGGYEDGDRGDCPPGWQGQGGRSGRR